MGNSMTDYYADRDAEIADERRRTTYHIVMSPTEKELLDQFLKSIYLPARENHTIIVTKLMYPEKRLSPIPVDNTKALK